MSKNTIMLINSVYADEKALVNSVKDYRDAEYAPKGKISMDYSQSMALATLTVQFRMYEEISEAYNEELKKASSATIAMENEVKTYQSLLEYKAGKELKSQWAGHVLSLNNQIKTLKKYSKELKANRKEELETFCPNVLQSEKTFEQAYDAYVATVSGTNEARIAFAEKLQDLTGLPMEFCERMSNLTSYTRTTKKERESGVDTPIKALGIRAFRNWCVRECVHVAINSSAIKAQDIKKAAHRALN